MSDLMVDMALSHFGFDDAQKAEIMAALPKIQVVMDFVKTHKTMVNQLIDTGHMVITQINKQESGS